VGCGTERWRSKSSAAWAARAASLALTLEKSRSPVPRESGSHHVPIEFRSGDSSSSAFPINVRCGALDLDVASFACESQTAGLAESPGCSNRRAPGDCDFKRKQERAGQAGALSAGGSGLHELVP